MNKSGERVRFYVECGSGLVRTAAIFAALSAVFRIIGCWGVWSDERAAVLQLYLPLGCSLVFVACLLLLGKRALWATALPVIVGAVFFVLRTFSYDNVLLTLVCVLLCIVAAVLYTMTVFGTVRTKWLLVPFFGLPFLYKLLVQDVAALKNTAEPVTFSDGMQEISVLCILLAMIMTTIAMKKKKPDITEAELPKIKAPKVIVPGKKEAEEISSETAVIGTEAAAYAAAEADTETEIKTETEPAIAEETAAIPESEGQA